MTASLVLRVDVDATVQQTWDAAVDWDNQSAWMMGTTVRAVSFEGAAVDGEIEAITGVGPFRVRDTMRIVRWEPPRVCDVVHTGRVVRGTGRFEVLERPGGSTFVWREDLDLPLGVVGRLGWVLVRPLFRKGVQVSLNRFARWVISDPRSVESP